ncbi:hypothetical protein CEXT_498911 [Caerostris extrusa]|uniref:Uncharacterized protein n=1 Tax=Caerostris extrusa TaxID=172846 RepID=A0AAV4Y171_CAEEX|nr:hypothetical protein CEXT_498911 [Caerostris extrusa]
MYLNTPKAEKNSKEICIVDFFSLANIRRFIGPTSSHSRRKARPKNKFSGLLANIYCLLYCEMESEKRSRNSKTAISQVNKKIYFIYNRPLYFTSPNLILLLCGCIRKRATEKKESKQPRRMLPAICFCNSEPVTRHFLEKLKMQQQIGPKAVGIHWKMALFEGELGFFSCLTVLFLYETHFSKIMRKQQF